jgi:hypothetical protein
MENLHLIDVKYYGPTNSQGSRVRLRSHRFKETKWLSYDYSIGDILSQAEEYLIKDGHNVVSHCETENGYGVLCSTDKAHMFRSLKDK